MATTVTQRPSLGNEWLRSGRVYLLWVLVLSITILPILRARYPPLDDYPVWLMEGRLVWELLFAPAGGLAASHYYLDWTPDPNLAAPVVISLLNLFFSPESAGRVFLVLIVLLFAVAFGVLVRAAQHRVTAMEFMGAVFALGYFMYNGNLSYLFSLSLMLLGTSRLQSIHSSPNPRLVSVGDVLWLGLISVGAYLSHFLGWLPFVVVTLVYVAVLWRRTRRALLITVALAPSLVLLLSYAAIRLIGSGIGVSGLSVEVYQSITSKLGSLVVPLLLYSPAIRCPPAVSTTLLLNIGFLGLVGALFLLNLDFHSPLSDMSKTLILAAGVLLVCAICIPFSSIVDRELWLGGPDQRFVLPAVLLALSAFRFKRISKMHAGLAVACVAVIALFHVAEWGQASDFLAGVESAARTAIPPGAQVLSVSIETPPQGTQVLSAGIHPLRWFAIYHLLETGGTTAENDLNWNISLLKRRDSATPFELEMVMLQPDASTAMVTAQAPVLSDRQRVELFGCPSDVEAVAQALTPEYATTTSGYGYQILAQRAP